VRRRRWVRTRIPRPPDLDDPGRPLFAAWTVDVQPSGETRLILESTVKLVNELNLDLDVRAFITPGDPPHDVKPLKAMSTECLPVLLAYALQLSVKPREGSWGWSAPFLVDKLTAVEEVAVECPRVGDDPDVLPLHVVVQVNHHHHHHHDHHHRRRHRHRHHQHNLISEVRTWWCR
jgi:hypothetical protein